jgi:hypothetical protein
VIKVFFGDVRHSQLLWPADTAASGLSIRARSLRGVPRRIS